MIETGYEHLTDQQVAELLKRGDWAPYNPETGKTYPHEQAQTLRQLGQVDALDPKAPPGSARWPRVQASPEDKPEPGQFYIEAGTGHVRQADGHPVDDRTRAFARGIPIVGAAADEFNSLTAAALAPALEPRLREAPEPIRKFFGYNENSEIGNLPTFRERFDASQNLQRFKDQSFDQRHPWQSGGLQLGGAVAGTVAGLPLLAPLSRAAIGAEAGLGLRSGAAAVEGAGLGGTHGYLSGYGGASDPSRTGGAVTGAVFGGGLGAAAPVASHVAGQAWRATGGRVIDALRGNRVVQGGEGDFPSKIARILSGGGDASSEATEAARVVASQPDHIARASEVDDAYVRIARALQRGQMTPEQAHAEALRLGSFGTLADSGPATQDLLRAAVNRPGNGATIARQNLEPRQQGVFNAETGQWDVRPSSLRVTDEAARGLGVEGRGYGEQMDAILAARKAASDPAYAKLREAPPVDIRLLGKFASSPDFRRAYEAARKISEKEFVKVPGVDGEVIMPLPEQMPTHLDWRTLDLMKQAMDDVSFPIKPPEGIGANDLGATKGFRARFIETLDALNPDYKAARDAYSGPTAMKNALEEGRSLLSEDAYSMGKRLKEMSEAERDMARLGALEALQNKLGNTDVTSDAARVAGLLKPNQLMRFRELFPTPEAFSQFITKMRAERTMFGTNQAAFGNSTTTKQILNVMEPSDPQIEGSGQALTAVAQQNPLALIQAVRKLGMESPMSEATAGTISSVLTNYDRAAMAEAIAKIAKASSGLKARDSARAAQGSVASQVAAIMAGEPKN